jgi:hypothetical protein
MTTVADHPALPHRSRSTVHGSDVMTVLECYTSTLGVRAVELVLVAGEIVRLVVHWESGNKHELIVMGALMTEQVAMNRGAKADAQPSERCTRCTHPKDDHDGRADHREKYPPLVAGEPWCHACNAECDYIRHELIVTEDA